jgi:hypothetical protein
MKYLTVLLLSFPFVVLAEQTRGGLVKKIEVVNYRDGAAYVYFQDQVFDECPVATNWCAIDFSLVSADQMYSAVLAAKFAQKEIRVTTNSCWADNYARCWKIHVD